MNLPKVVSQREWKEARKLLLAKEKAATQARDALNRERRELPMVKVEKSYRFDGAQGQLGLRELFEGRKQLIVCHIMFHREQGQACSGCSFSVDNLPLLAHLHARETTLVLVSRAPLPELERFQARMGWSVPWYSSYGSEFNYDFHATTDEAIAAVEYNYRDKETLERLGQTYHVQGEQPGVSVFLREGGSIYHTYSTYGRGLDAFLTTYSYLDLTPFGRGEGWDGMPNLHGIGRSWLRHHDRYDE